jgi:hypothetical protein
VISREQVRDSFFSDGAHASSLALLDGLITSQDSPGIDLEASAAVLDAVASIADSGGDLLGALLYATAEDHKPLLGPLLERFSLSREQTGKLLSQYAKEEDDEHYPQLDLSRQQLQSVPDGIELAEVPVTMIDLGDGPQPYNEIDLSFNPMTSLTVEEVRALDHFGSIHLVGWRIRQLPDALRHLTNVIKLNLSWSDLVELPDFLFTLTSLRALCLNWTSVATIPDQITHLPLMYIEVSETPFLSTLYAARESEPDTDAKRAALHTAELLAAMGCRIDE